MPQLTKSSFQYARICLFFGGYVLVKMQYPRSEFAVVLSFLGHLVRGEEPYDSYIAGVIYV
jgi:hypothetical protein